jgi:hypothetical protein
VASCIAVAVAAAGIRGVEAAWPISSHPTFAEKGTPPRLVRIVAEDETGERVALSHAFPWLDVARRGAIERHIVFSPPRERARQLIDLWRDGAATLLPGARTVTFVALDLRPRTGGGLTVVRSRVLLTIRP